MAVIPSKPNTSTTPYCTILKNDISVSAQEEVV